VSRPDLNGREASDLVSAKVLNNVVPHAHIPLLWPRHAMDMNPHKFPFHTTLDAYNDQLHI